MIIRNGFLMTSIPTRKRKFYVSISVRKADSSTIGASQTVWGRRGNVREQFSYLHKNFSDIKIPKLLSHMNLFSDLSSQKFPLIPHIRENDLFVYFRIRPSSSNNTKLALSRTSNLFLSFQ